VEPQLGRAFTAEEDQPHGAKVAVLMHSFWQQYFGSDPHVLGQTVTLDGAPYAVVGVMPASFRFPGDSEAQMLFPAGLAGLDESGGLLNTSQHMLGIIGRLKRGATAVLAQNELDAIRKRAERYQTG